MKARFLFIACLVCFLSASPAFAGVISTFDSDLDGWTYTGDAASTFEWRHDAGRNGGGIYWHDAAVSKGDYAFAPAKFLGDWSQQTTFAFDMRRGSNTTSSNLELYFESSEGTHTVNLGKDYGETWKTYTIDLANDLFPYVDQTSISMVRIKVDLVVGRDESFLDNVALVPEPATLALLGMGGLALLRRHRG